MHITIFDIKRFAIHDGPGIRTTVFFKGCPMSCWWCHNPESRDLECQSYAKKLQLNGKQFERQQTVGRKVDVDELFAEIVKDKVFYEESAGGVTFSGGEPLLQADGLAAISKLCKKSSIHTTLDTSGYLETNKFLESTKSIDLFLFDVKHLDDEMHKECTGVSNRQILENLSALKQLKKNVMIRFPVIPDINTGEKHLEMMDKFLLKLKSEHIHQIDLLPYHKIGSDKYERFGIESHNIDFYEPDEELLAKLKERFEKLEYTVKIGG